MALELVADTALKGRVSVSMGGGVSAPLLVRNTLSFCLYCPGPTLLEESKGLSHTQQGSPFGPI